MLFGFFYQCARKCSDKIVNDEVPVVVHRILAFLLLGIVRIYLKKVEYLFHDCQDVLNKLRDFTIGKSTRAGSGVSHRHDKLITLNKRLELSGLLRTCDNSNIILPQRFELDAFDLEIGVDQDLDSRNIRPNKEIMLADGGREESDTRGLFDVENISFSLADSTAYTTPTRDVLSLHYMDQDYFMSPSNNIKNSIESLEILCGTSYFLEDRLDPMLLDEAEEELMQLKPSNENLATVPRKTLEMDYDSVVNASHNKSDAVPSLEMIHGTGFSLDSYLDHMVLDEGDKEQMNHMPFNDDIGISVNVLTENEMGHYCDMSSNKEDINDEKHIKGPTKPLSFKEDALENFTPLVDVEEHVGAQKIKLPEPLTQESRNEKIIEVWPVSIRVDVTPDSKLAGNVATPGFVSVQTPAPKERPKILKKRKTLFDLTMVVPSNEYKDWIHDPKDLIRKRRKVAHTHLHASRAHKLCHIAHSFVEPYISIDLHSLQSVEKTSQTLELSSTQDEARSPVACPDVNSVVTHEVEVQMPDVMISPVREQTPIAPGTPVARLNAFRSHEFKSVAESHIIEPTSSTEGLEGLDMGSVLGNESNSLEGECLEMDIYSARTRVVGGFLYKNFRHKKRKKEDEVLNVSQLLEGRTKKESARLFYEILVLKTRDCIDVQQEKAYGDILLRKTSKLEAAES